MLFDVKKGNNLMLTGLTSVATLLERHWVRFALNEAWHCVCVCDDDQLASTLDCPSATCVRLL